MEREERESDREEKERERDKDKNIANEENKHVKIKAVVLSQRTCIFIT